MRFEAGIVCRNAEVARRVILKDMGNGVDRVEVAEVMGLDAARDEAKLPGRVPVNVSDDPRLQDLCDDLYLCHCGECVFCGFLRPVDDSSVELIVWCRH